MKIQRLAIALTVINFVVLFVLVAQIRKAEAQNTLPMLRGRGLEIVDAQGRVRASITVEPPVTMNGRTYSETVLLRLTDPKNGPVVKIQANDDGSALSFSDDVEGGVQVFATRHKGNFVKVVDRTGKEQTVKP